MRNGKLAKTAQPSKNGSAGQQKNGKELPTNVSYAKLGSWIQRILRMQTLREDPDFLEDFEVKRFFAEDICPVAPELANLTVRSMRTMMKDARADRKRRTNSRGVLTS